MSTNTIARQTRRSRILRFSLFVTLPLLTLLGSSFLTSQPARAVAGINEQLNYQARLLNGAGAVVSDGTYNMRFKVYQDGTGCVVNGTSPCGGTLKWTETRTTTDRVTIKNGYFSVELGSVNPFGNSIDWNQSALWLSIEIGGTATSPTWDGEMLPFRRLSSTPYAMNAGKLGGLDASKFLQVAPAAVQIDSGTLDSLFLNKTGAAGNVLRLQKNGSDIFVVDGNGKVAIGGAFTPTESLDVAGNLQIKDAATATKSYRLRTSGGALDFEAAGADLHLSTWSGADYTGTQYNQITFKADGSSMDFQRGLNVINGAKVGLGVNDPAEILDVNGAIQQTGRTTSNTGATDNNKWTKLGSCAMNAQYQECIATLSILGGRDGTATNNSQADVSLRARQQDPMGGAPIVNVQLNGTANVINNTDIVAVTTQNTGVVTEIELWGRITNIYEAWNFAPGINFGNKWAWFSTAGFSAALPAGVQTEGVYGGLQTNELQVSGGIQMLNATNDVVFDADSTTNTFTFGSNNTAGKHVSFDLGDDDGIVSVGSADGNAITIGQYNAGAAEITHDTDLHILRSTNSTTAFELLDAGNNVLFSMDGVNKRFSIKGGGTGSGGSRLHFGDYDNVFIGENGTSDTDRMLLYGGEGFTIQSHYGTPVTISGAGLTVFKTSSNNASAFQIQNSSSEAQFNVDTSGSRVNIGPAAGSTTGTLLVFGNKTGAGDPTGTNGAMYYNVSMGVMRCFTDGAWTHCNNPTRLTRGFNIQEEFIGSSNGGTSFNCGSTNITTTHGWACYAANGSATITTVTSDSYKRPGQIQIQTGTATNGMGSVYLSGGSTPGFMIGGGESFETAINIPTLSTGAQQFILRAGLCDVNNHASDCSNGAYFEYDSNTSANWRYATANNSTRTKNSSSKVVATGWTNLKFVVNSTSSVTFYVKNAGDTNYTSLGTITTNIPTTNNSTIMIHLDKMAGTTSRTTTVDYVDYWNDFTSPR